MKANSKKRAEIELYEPIRKYLIKRLKRSFSNYYLEVTSRGKYSETLKHLVRQDIVFHFLKKASPDLTGFILREDLSESIATSSDVKSFITVEVKRDENITLQDIYQAKMYGDLFCAKYALLISTEIIGEEIRRLHDRLSILNRFRGWKVYVGQVVSKREGKSTITVTDCIWFPRDPF